jgi:ketosteroid isomerase-like protein
VANLAVSAAFSLFFQVPAMRPWPALSINRTWPDKRRHAWNVRLLESTRPMNPQRFSRLMMAAAFAFLQGCAIAPNPETTIAELKALSDRWDDAIVRKDRRAIEENMANDFRQIDGSGNVETKTSFVEDLMSVDLQINPYAVEEFEVRLYGNVALLSGRTRMSGQYKGKPFNSHYRYIDVYVRDRQGWKIVSVHITKLPG